MTRHNPGMSRQHARFVVLGAIGFVLVMSGRVFTPKQTTATPGGPDNVTRLRSILDSIDGVWPHQAPPASPKEIPLAMFAPAPQPSRPPQAAHALDDQARIDQAIRTMTVQAVLVGASTYAIVNNRVVRPGDTVGGFEVQSIDASGVVLTKDGLLVELSPASLP